eukprot:CAMPEP_0194206390 /NCGR_PEP_ID=MMETSP0156-20130528/5439_1 /TAXON_ID=33649 /ORGANISM="Thalassionema nitzschioides, Strain L26-B" /LENGTH=321 /DNA_ID=CAMNT_0038932911 /DNA_START=130 /DNA_END=1095 /DNA_ORIENTATION=+
MADKNDVDYYHHMRDPMESRPPSLKRMESLSNSNNNFQESDEEEVYLVKQEYGYFAYLFSFAQTVILIIMMWQCSVAPLNINPMIGPYPDALSEWGGKNAVNIIDDGEWWRLLTPMMLHAGVIHLFSNIAVQLESGAFFEREWGSLNWLIIYCVSAVGSSILSVIFMPNSISVGSSGAVMGLFGAKLAEVMCRCCESEDSRQKRVAHTVRKEQCGGTLCAVTLVMAFSFIPYVDWAAHLGGLLAGLLAGFAVFSCSMEMMMSRIFWFLLGTAVTVTAFVMSLNYMYSGVIDPAEELRDVCGYYQQFFDDYECHCMRGEHEG